MARLDDEMASGGNPEDTGLSFALSDNIALMESMFADVDLVQYRAFSVEGEPPLAMCLVYLDGMVNSEMMDMHILAPLMRVEGGKDTFGNRAQIMDTLADRILQINSVKKVKKLDEIAPSVLYGDTLLLVEGCADALLLDTKKFVSRGISEPDGEKILSGPREGFCEVLLQNISMLCRKLNTQDLKIKRYDIGERSNTKTFIAYMDSLVNKRVLQELYARLDKIDIDAVLDANYITELIRDNKWSTFRTVGYTERPDVVAAKLLEGRVAIFVDGTPVVLTVPYLFIENFQSNEDYYLSFFYTSFSRLLRILGFFLAVTVPALYIAIVSFHHEMLPTPMMINIAIDSYNVPLPAALECFTLLIMFDILRETGIRMPLGVGQALSIVGALVVGTAAVEADLVSSPMIIIVAVSGITSLLIPKMNASITLIRLKLLMVSAAFGFYGLIMGMAIEFIHILRLESFGIYQLTRDKPFRYQLVKDTLIRAPWWQMIQRPPVLSKDLIRQRRRR